MSNLRICPLKILMAGLILFSCEKEVDSPEKVKFLKVSAEISGNWIWILGSAVTENNDVISYYSGELNDCSRISNLFVCQDLSIVPNNESLDFNITKRDLCNETTLHTKWKLDLDYSSDRILKFVEQNSNGETDMISLILEEDDDQHQRIVIEQTGEFQKTDPKVVKLGIYYYKQ